MAEQELCDVLKDLEWRDPICEFYVLCNQCMVKGWMKLSEWVSEYVNWVGQRWLIVQLDIGGQFMWYLLESRTNSHHHYVNWPKESLVGRAVN